jgi:uncharacterized protein
MNGEKNLYTLLQSMKPTLQIGGYVFCIAKEGVFIEEKDILMSFKEKEGKTIILKKEVADELRLAYSFEAAWITLSIHSSLEAVGLTAAFSKMLADENISCNVVAAFYHDHIFVNVADAQKAMQILQKNPSL